MMGNRRIWRLAASVWLTLALVLGSWSAPSPNSQAQPVGDAAIVPNRYIVRIKPGTFATADAAARTYDAMAGVTIDQVYGAAISGFAGTFTSAAVERLLADPGVLDISPDREYETAAQNTPPGVLRVGAGLNPTSAGDGEGVVDADIAIIDTGVYRHPDLNVAGGKDCTNTSRSGAFNDLSGHGTHVAGIAAAMDNDFGVVGIAPGARIWSLKIFSDDNYPRARESEVICALNWVTQNAATIDVANLSIGLDYYYDLGGCAQTAIHEAYCRTVDAGVTVVVAAQNWTINARTTVPAQFDEVITVSASYDSDGKRGGLGPSSACTPRGQQTRTQRDDRMACFSNYGQDIDISAPGHLVYSTWSGVSRFGSCPGRLYCTLSGTSMSTPLVAGAVALIHAQQGPLSPAEMKARLLATAERGPVAGDPDGFPEPLLNVAQLGPGAISAPESAQPGKKIRIKATAFTPGERAIFRFDGEYIGGANVLNSGNAYRTMIIPEMPGGTYEITVSTGQKRVTTTIDVAPKIAVDVTSGPPGTNVQVQLQGFHARESVVVQINTGTAIRKLVRIRVDETGNGAGTLTIPPANGRDHFLMAEGDSGSQATVHFWVKPAVALAAGTPEPNRLIRIAFTGFGGNEAITARFDKQDGPALGGATASLSGSGSLSVRIPAGTSPGRHYVWLIGDQATRLRLTIDVVAPNPTMTPTATATATATPESTEAPATEPPPPTEVPPTGAPPTDVPGTEAPPTEAPPTEAPPTEVPATDTPVETTEPGG